MSLRELLHDPDTRAWVLLASNLVGGFLGSRVSVRQCRRAARAGALAAVAPFRADLQSLAGRMEAHEKFRSRLVRFLLAKWRHTNA
jgi:hypothetical protein